mmetsp:Transcript_14355/g.21257  ORF Transcript_14355/g.21257 Transcript_14355/m.21257 type:complete len:87 (+) Transcript_14355:113-373(+)
MVDVYEGATETLGGFDNEGGIDCDGLKDGAVSSDGGNVFLMGAKVGTSITGALVTDGALVKGLEGATETLDVLNNEGGIDCDGLAG